MAAMKYLICVTNRVGSSWLCSMLASTGIAGNPLEHFNLSEEGWTDFPAHYERISKIDPLGVKTSYPGLIRAASIVGDAEFAEWPCIFLRRRDTLAQAISNFRAMTTGQWWRRPGDSNECPAVTLDREAVLRMKAEYEHANTQHWPDWFRRHGISPFEIDYEDMCEDPAGIVTGVCQFLGVGNPTVIETGQFLVQRDELSVRWREEVNRG